MSFKKPILVYWLKLNLIWRKERFMCTFLFKLLLQNQNNNQYIILQKNIELLKILKTISPRFLNGECINNIIKNNFI